MNKQLLLTHLRTQPSASPVTQLSQLDRLRSPDQTLSRSKLFTQQSAKTKALKKRQSMKFFLKSKKQSSNQVLTMNEIYLKKLEISFVELEQGLKPILGIISDLQGEMKNRQTLFKVISRFLKDNYLSFIQFLLIENDKNDIISPLTFETIKSKLNSKAFTFYQLLINETKDNFLYKGLKPAQCLFNVLEEFLEQRKEERMNMMKGSIMKEWQQINNIMYNSYELRTQFRKKKEKFYPLSLSAFPPYSPADAFDRSEIMYGQFDKVSPQERRFNNNLSNMVAEIKTFQKGLDYDYLKKGYLQ